MRVNAVYAIGHWLRYGTEWLHSKRIRMNFGPRDFFSFSISISKIKSKKKKNLQKLNLW